MNNYIEDTDNELLDFPELTEIIHLDPEHSEQAWQITENVKAENGKLQIYFQALALVAFEEWLQKREPNLSVDRRQSSLLHPECTQEINAVCNLRVGEFKVCLIPTLSFSDEWVTIPQAVIDTPEFAAHFYIVIGVDDELEIATIKGFTRYEELVKTTAKIPVLSDGSYEVNVIEFRQETEELLIYLQCLFPTDIPVLKIPKLKLPAISYNSSNYLKDFTQIVNQKAVNAGLWVQNKLDEIAQELSCQLLPPPSPLLRYRPTAAEELDNILTAIDDVEIPAVAACIYRNLELAEIKLRLYAITWCLPEIEGGWSLLLILGAIPGDKPPLGLKLRISDLTELLDEQVLDSDNDYLFMQTEGNLEDKFLATITSANGQSETSVLFEFRP